MFKLKYETCFALLKETVLNCFKVGADSEQLQQCFHTRYKPETHRETISITQLNC